MRIPTSLSLITATALLTAAATVAQPQTATTSSSSTTTEGQSTSSTATGTGSGTPRSTSGTETGTTSGTPSTTTGMTEPTAPGTQSGTGSASGTTGTTTGTASGTTGGDAAASTTMGSSGNSLRGQDAEFLRKAMSSGTEEVQNAQLAMQQAQRSETRNAASMMLQDHQRSNQQLQSLAQRKGWPTDTSAASAQSDEARSGVESGSGDFDSRYVAEEIRHHREAIAEFRKEASAGSDPDLRQFATDTLPALEHHLQMLESANTSK